MKAKIYNFTNQEHFDNFITVCEKISAKDATFKFEANRGGLEVMMFADTKDQLHKRCTWLVTRADPMERLVYAIIKEEK